MVYTGAREWNNGVAVLLSERVSQCVLKINNATGRNYSWQTRMHRLENEGKETVLEIMAWEKNLTGQIVVDFFRRHKMVVANTLFQQEKEECIHGSPLGVRLTINWPTSY